MKSVIFALALVAAAASTVSGLSPSYASLTPSEQEAVQTKLAEWKSRFGAVAQERGLVPSSSRESIRINGHSVEELERFQTTIMEAQEAAKLNPQAQFSEFNVFALVTMDEFKAHVQKSLEDPRPEMIEPLVEEEPMPRALAKSIDWTKNSTCVTAVRSQGKCGSCWAFAAVAVVESAHCLATGEILDLSEQQLVSCDTYSSGCDGGYGSAAVTNMVKNGVCLEQSYPYTSGTTKETGTCVSTCTKRKLAIGATQRVSGESKLLAALANQPVAVTVEAGNPVWRTYVGGVVTQCPGNRSDHEVLAVGYGTSSDDYVKIKNSWGALWGDKGYIYLKRGVSGVGTCNVMQSIWFPKLVARSPSPTTTAPTTASPKTTTRSPSSTPAPTTEAPGTPTTTRPVTSSPLPTTANAVCGACKGCYIPSASWCVSSAFTKDECAANNGVWCGR